jgi:hypothetical protein
MLPHSFRDTYAISIRQLAHSLLEKLITLGGANIIAHLETETEIPQVLELLAVERPSREEAVRPSLDIITIVKQKVRHNSSV